MSRQAQWNNVRLTERERERRKGEEGTMVAKSDSNGRSAIPTTAIPYSGGLAGDCGFAYPLLVYWNRSLSVPLSPSLSLYSKIIPSRSLSRLLSSSFHPFRTLHPPSYTFRRSFFDSVLSTKRTRFTALRDFISPRSLPPRLRLSLSIYLSLSLRFSPLRYPPRRPSATYTKPTGPRLLLRDTR